jgi:uncharacterized protein YecE (DUF72 family)
VAVDDAGATVTERTAALVIHVGTSGWSYYHWHGVAYPHCIPPRQRLAHYAGRFRTVEVNSSYYLWPADSTFASWRRRTPDGFTMTIKAPKGLTHIKRLYAPERWLTRIGAGMHRLGEKRGVLLVQLSPRFAYDHTRLEYFLRQVPSWLRLAYEFRHRSWHREEIFDLLERHSAAYCVMSGANLPCVLQATAPFVYVRLHGPDHHHLYAGSYSDDDLRWWADRIREWVAQGCDVFAYFNNDGSGHAVRNAETLVGLLGR